MRQRRECVGSKTEILHLSDSRSEMRHSSVFFHHSGSLISLSLPLYCHDPNHERLHIHLENGKMEETLIWLKNCMKSLRSEHLASNCQKEYENFCLAQIIECGLQTDDDANSNLGQN